MKLKLALVCDGARERPDGKLDVSGVFDELSAPGFPAMQERMTAVFVVAWEEAEVGRQPLRADLVDEAGERILTIQGHTEVRPPGAGRPPSQTRLLMALERVVFPHEGQYRFDLIAGGTILPACTLFVGQSAPDPRPEERV